MQRIPTVADALGLQPSDNLRIFYSAADVGGATWYRLRLGNFASADEALVTLEKLKADFPGAWIDELDAGAAVTELLGHVIEDAPTQVGQRAASGNTKVDALMDEARTMMVEGDVSRAIQIYTKVLQLPDLALPACAGKERPDGARESGV